jgi:CrcB protein
VTGKDAVTFLLVFVGGAVGAPARYLIDRFVQRWRNSVFPWGTLTVNLIGSFVLGVLIGAGSGASGPPTGQDTSGLLAALGGPGGIVTTLAGTGFCGALTTFSTFGFETVRLLEEGSLLEAALNAAASLVLGLIVAFAGYTLALNLA